MLWSVEPITAAPGVPMPCPRCRVGQASDEGSMPHHRTTINVSRALLAAILGVVLPPTWAEAAPRTVWQLGTKYTTSPGVFTPEVYHGVYPSRAACDRQAQVELRKLNARLKNKYRTLSACRPVVQHPVDPDTIEGDECDGC